MSSAFLSGRVPIDKQVVGPKPPLYCSCMLKLLRNFFLCLNSDW